MVYTPKVVPPLDEIEIETRFNRGHRENKPHLIVSLDCLEKILAREKSFIAVADIPRLLAALCGYAMKADIGDTHLASNLDGQYRRQWKAHVKKTRPYKEPKEPDG
jgi:hypothetical protein